MTLRIMYIHTRARGDLSGDSWQYSLKLRWEMSRRAPRITLTTEARRALERMVRAPTTPQAWVLRARIVLAASEGTPNQEIAAQLGVTPGKSLGVPVDHTENEIRPSAAI